MHLESISLHIMMCIHAVYTWKGKISSQGFLHFKKSNCRYSSMDCCSCTSSRFQYGYQYENELEVNISCIKELHTAQSQRIHDLHMRFIVLSSNRSCLLIGFYPGWLGCIGWLTTSGKVRRHCLGYHACVKRPSQVEVSSRSVTEFRLGQRSWTPGWFLLLSFWDTENPHCHFSPWILCTCYF